MIGEWTTGGNFLVETKMMKNPGRDNTVGKPVDLQSTDFLLSFWSKYNFKDEAL